MYRIYPVFAPKNYNFESNSQLNRCQFKMLRFLFSRRKITILKAIHNNCATSNESEIPVFAPKNYNFESNSQRGFLSHYRSVTCFCAEKLQF